MTVLSWLATVFTVAMFATNFNTLRSFHKARSTGPTPFLPFVATFLNCIFWTKYGILRADTTIILVNCIGTTIAAYCMLSFYYWTETKRPPERMFLTGILLVYLVLGYVKLNHNLQTVGLVGNLCCIVTVIMFGSPLSLLKTIIRNKNTDGLSFPLAVVSLITCILWVLYGMTLMDPNIIVPNAIGGVLSVIQCIVYVVYRNATPATFGVPSSDVKLNFGRGE